MNLKTLFSLCKHVKCSPSTLRRRNLKTQQPPVISDSCLRNWSHIIVMWSFSKSCLFLLLFVYTKSQIKPVFSNSFGLKGVFEKLRFRDELALTVGSTVEIKLCRMNGAKYSNRCPSPLSNRINKHFILNQSETKTDWELVFAPFSLTSHFHVSCFSIWEVEHRTRFETEVKLSNSKMVYWRWLQGFVLSCDWFVT